MNNINSRINSMAERGRIHFRHGAMIDAYNQCCHDKIAITILTRVSSSNHYFVITDDEI